MIHRTELCPFAIGGREVRKECLEPVKASHAFHVGDVVFTVLSQAAASGQKLQRQASRPQAVAAGVEYFGKRLLYSHIRPVGVSRWQDKTVVPSFEPEPDPLLRLGCRCHYYRSGRRKLLLRFEIEYREALFVEEFIEDPRLVVRFYLTLEIVKVLDGDYFPPTLHAFKG